MDCFFFGRVWLHDPERDKAVLTKWMDGIFFTASIFTLCCKITHSQYVIFLYMKYFCTVVTEIPFWNIYTNNVSSQKCIKSKKYIFYICFWSTKWIELSTHSTAFNYVLPYRFKRKIMTFKFFHCHTLLSKVCYFNKNAPPLSTFSTTTTLFFPPVRLPVFPLCLVSMTSGLSALWALDWVDLDLMFSEWAVRLLAYFFCTSAQGKKTARKRLRSIDWCGWSKARQQLCFQKLPSLRLFSIFLLSVMLPSIDGLFSNGFFSIFYFSFLGTFSNNMRFTHCSTEINLEILNIDTV